MFNIPFLFKVFIWYIIRLYVIYCLNPFNLIHIKIYLVSVMENYIYEIVNIKEIKYIAFAMWHPVYYMLSKQNCLKMRIWTGSGTQC